MVLCHNDTNYLKHTNTLLFGYWNYDTVTSYSSLLDGNFINCCCNHVSLGVQSTIRLAILWYLTQILRCIKPRSSSWCSVQVHVRWRSYCTLLEKDLHAFLSGELKWNSWMFNASDTVYHDGVKEIYDTAWVYNMHYVLTTWEREGRHQKSLPCQNYCVCTIKATKLLGFAKMTVAIQFYVYRSHHCI